MSNSSGQISFRAELIEAITRDLKISPQEYLDRAAKAQELGAYAQEFKSERPGDYAGSWMGLDGQPVVAVTTTEAARIAADDGYRTHVAPVSADTLEKTLADVNGWIAGLPKEILTRSQFGDYRRPEQPGRHRRREQPRRAGAQSSDPAREHQDRSQPGRWRIG